MTNILQDIFIAIMTPMLKASCKITWKIKYQLITLMFLFIIVNTWLTRVLGYMKYYKYYALLGVGCMFVIAFLSLDGSLGRIKWNWKITASWYSICVVMIISDYVVMSEEGYLGYILLFAFLIVTFIWDNHSRKDLLLRCLFKAVKYSFYVYLVICFFNIPMAGLARYEAFLTNPNVLAFYLFMVFCILFSEFDQAVQDQSYIKKSIPLFIEIGVCGFFLGISQSRTTVLALLFLLIVWGIIRISCNKKDKLKIAKYIYSLLVISVVSVSASNIVLTYLPGKVNHVKEYIGCNTITAYAHEENESINANLIQSNITKEKNVVASQLGTNIVKRFKMAWDSKSWDVITNKRNIVWKDYFKQLNVWGHKKNELKTDDYKWKHAHNNSIQFIHKYGIFILIPYVLLNCISVFYSYLYFKQWRKKLSYAIFPLLVIVGFNTITLTEALWHPFYNSLTFIYYFAITLIFNTKRN